MIIYNHAFDIYHCAYRMLYSLTILPEKEYHIGFFRLVDFYILFPHMISKVRMPPKFRSIKNELGKLRNNYNDIPSPRRLFNDLYNVQVQCINYLSSVSILDKRKVIDQFILKTDKKIPDDLNELIQLEIEDNEIITKAIVALSEIPFNGKDGLKDRTGLMEYRYDVD